MMGENNLHLQLPKKMMIEVSGACNHQCVFCINHEKKNGRGLIEHNLAVRLIREGAEIGIQELSFHGMGEPLLNKRLAGYISLAKNLDYNYVYIDTNGALARPDIINPLVDAGLDSVKFSVGAADKESYKKVHNRDDFDAVIRNIFELSKYRSSSRLSFKIIVDFVETVYTEGQFGRIKEIFSGKVDDIWFSPCTNQGGIMSDELLDRLQVKPGIEAEQEVCYEPFDRIVISAEGKVSGCCMFDDSGALIYGDVNNSTLKQEWKRKEHLELCNSHLTGNDLNSYCMKCELKKIFQRGKRYE